MVTIPAGPGAPSVTDRDQNQAQDPHAVRSGTQGTPPQPGTWPGVPWGVAGTGDFNRDRKVDVLWRHANAGQIVVWYLDNDIATRGELLDASTLTDLRWELRGTRDLDRDGRPDLLWRQAESGELVAWLLEGTSSRKGAI